MRRRTLTGCFFRRLPVQVITTEQGQALADELGIRYVETSAKTNAQVEDAFFTLARDVKLHLIDTAAVSSSTASGTAGAQGIDVGTGQTQGSKSNCCS